MLQQPSSPLQTPAFDFEQIEALYKTYSKPAYAFALKMLGEPALAEDAVQEAFLKYYRCPQNYDQARGPFFTWLLSVVRNICIDQLRKKKRITKFVSAASSVENEDTLADLVDESLSVEDEVWLSIQRTNVQAALKSIPVEQRHLIELAFFNGLTHKEIESATGIALGTVKSRIRQGLLKLKVHLDADNVVSQSHPVRDMLA